MYGNNYNPTSIGSIDAQIENLTRMKNSMQPQSPITNVINTANNIELEAKVLTGTETIENTLISRRTVFIDELKGIVAIKEVNGDLSRVYQILIPKDPKDEKIENLEKVLKEMEAKINELGNVTTNDEIGKPYRNDGKSSKK